MTVPADGAFAKSWFCVDGVFLAGPVSNAIGGLACFVTMYFTLYQRLKYDEKV